MKGNEPVTRTLNPRAVPIGAFPLLLGIATAGFAQAPPMLRSLTGPAASALSGGEAEGHQTSELGFSPGQSPLLQPLSPQVTRERAGWRRSAVNSSSPYWATDTQYGGSRAKAGALIGSLVGFTVGTVGFSLDEELRGEERDRVQLAFIVCTLWGTVGGLVGLGTGYLIKKEGSVRRSRAKVGALIGAGVGSAAGVVTWLSMTDSGAGGEEALFMMGTGGAFGYLVGLGIGDRIKAEGGERAVQPMASVGGAGRTTMGVRLRF